MFEKALIMGMIVVGLGWMFTSVVQVASPPGQGEGQGYVIQADDWLSKLAEKYLGDAHLWSQIVEATNIRAVVDPRLEIIENPNVINAGQIVFIPTVSPTLPGSVEPSLERASLSILCQDQHPAVQAFCSEIPIARLQCNPYDEAEFFTCVSRAGLSNVQLGHSPR